jgi:LuxR family maltose regulon positive regulatory protein
LWLSRAIVPYLITSVRKSESIPCCSGIRSSLICRENRYFIYWDEIECDSDLFEKIYEEFRLKNTKEQAKKLLSLYKGEYLSNFEAHWAAAKRIRYHEIYEEARKYLFVN